MLWAQIKAETEGRREVDESGELMRRFFPTMKNMVLKYPKREEPACLSGRLGNLP